MMQFAGLNLLLVIYTPDRQGSGSDDTWSNRHAANNIRNSRHWWLNNWIYFVYLVVLGGIGLGFRKYELSRIKLKESMRIANMETDKLKELDHLKSQFFANISHEFRTPLTLIKGPLENLIEEENDVQKNYSLKLMLANVSRLLQLINQLLDLSSIESGNYNIRAVRGNILEFIEGLTWSFKSLAIQKSITLLTEISPDLERDKSNTDFYYDPDILEKIFSNLLSNAIKFTPERGSIIVRICITKVNNRAEYLEVVIRDTGIGISAGSLPHIYDRFYQADNSSKKKFGGTGIGLAYVKELVSIHKAEIRVSSIQGSGTEFTLRFPAGKDHFTSDQVVSSISGIVPQRTNPGLQLKVNNTLNQSGKVNHTHEGPLVLIVEDHQDVSHYIAQSIREEYQVAEVSNARDGFKTAEQLIPDLIISDIMMPEMDGYELCEIIKSSDKTSHIPVILLTARADDTDRITGLEKGADDYIVKPFNVKELRIRIKNLINNRRALRERFSSGQVIKPSEISVISREAVFMEKLLRIVENNIENTDFSVEDLGREAGMSASQMHRKLKAIVNLPATHFIRSVRMHRAMVLLQKHSGNISDIAYMVGYDDPGYFTKTFRTFFGKLPSEIIKK